MIVIHGLADALTAIDAARAAGQKIDLITPPAASAYIGPAMFKEIVDAARRYGGDAVGDIYYDCGPYPGHALAGLRAGLTDFCLEEGAASAALRDIVGQTHATLRLR